LPKDLGSTATLAANTANTAQASQNVTTHLTYPRELSGHLPRV
jgi:hypothetical protein